MKSVTFYFIAVFILTSCTNKITSNEPNIKSWETISPVHLNQKILQAYKDNQSWVNTPELYTFNLLDITSLKNISYRYKADNIESPKSVSIKIIRDGF